MERFDIEHNRLHLEPLALGGRLSILTLVKHASDAVGLALDKWKAEDEAWGRVQVGDFAPVRRCDTHTERESHSGRGVIEWTI